MSARGPIEAARCTHRGRDHRPARALVFVAPVFVAFALACSPRHPAPTAPVALPPHLSAEFPSSRSVHIQSDTPIWAEFDRSLDPSTVDPRHVFLKVDTRRLPVTVSYDDTRHRVTIVPQVQLALLTTHTVEFSPSLKSANGDTLGSGVFWQFTISSLRRLRAPYPPDSATGESPYARLSWGGTEEFPGSVVYDVYAGVDSAAVAARSAPAIGHTIDTFVLPPARWPQDGPLFWSVHERHAGTGEELDGPVWQFTPLPASTPIDSITVPASDWFYGTIYVSPYGGVTYSAGCKRDSILVAPGYDNAVRFNFSGVSPGIRLAGAAYQVTPLPNYQSNLPRGISIITITNVYSSCVSSNALSNVTLPRRGTSLATGVAANPRIRFSSDTFSAYLESEVRHGGLHQIAYQSGQRSALYTPSVALVLASSVPVLKLYVYRPGPAPVSAPARLAHR
ncbi:MAG: Ig-like domain-containing protein [Candidatus Eisenbacteria bacterium]|nr:Ig-like domain-containing protein [Candidatus Eisenbacteria bacterium]